MVEQGNPQHRILMTAEAIRPDLIVLGRKKGGPFRRMIFGGVSKDILDEASCPVLLINDKGSANEPGI
jgi:nucleotide-binding universal stress UspA family protein